MAQVRVAMIEKRRRMVPQRGPLLLEIGGEDADSPEGFLLWTYIRRASTRRITRQEKPSAKLTEAAWRVSSASVLRPSREVNIRPPYPIPTIWCIQRANGSIRRRPRPAVTLRHHSQHPCQVSRCNGPACLRKRYHRSRICRLA